MKKSETRRILFLDILTGDRDLRTTINEKVYGGGTYSDAMRKAFGLRKDEWKSLDASSGKFPKNIKVFSAIVIGGSTEDPISGKEIRWIRKTYPFIRLAIKNKIPILGICGGLQFVIRVLGGRVVLNPKGREFGNTRIVLSRSGGQDPIFKGLPKHVIVQSSHKCMAKGLKSSWRIMASSKLCGIQGIAIGNTVRLVQFHPEMKIKEIKAIANMRKRALIKEGFVKNEMDFRRLVGSIKDTRGVGKKILRNFLRYFV